MTFPMGENPEDPDTVVLGRMANIMIPFTLLDTGRVVRVLLSMPEADARAIVNMHPDQAKSMGMFFEVLKDHMTEFIRQEG
jgi:hypothetical protein